MSLRLFLYNLRLVLSFIGGRRLAENFAVSLENVSVSYGENDVLKNFNLNIKSGEFVTLLGPSGCGKTTILKLIGGFTNADSGKIYLSSKDVTNLPPHKREVNTVFQNYALFNHLNVFENIAFGPRVKKRKEKEINSIVKNMLKLVSLSGFEERSVESLSGGQQQRVAIARALANEPKVLLLDEPLAALDLKLRKDMQTELKNIQKKMGITFVFVTHDQEEALSMANTVVVMDGGKIQQVGSPTDIYNEPKNAFVANFIGESNILDGTMIDDYTVRFAGKKFRCLDFGFSKMEKVDVVIRPEDVKVVSKDEGDIFGIVTQVTFKGVHYEIIVDVNNFKWMIQSTKSEVVGSFIGLILGPDDIHIMKKSEHSGEYGDYTSFSDEMYEAFGAKGDKQ